ncbi:MAG TPA: nitrous oxide reductase family maturation protein NosD, partial [Gammaproteobacteria bacterium]
NTAFAALHVVTPNGPSLQHMIAQAAPGDVIEISGGNYAGNFIVDKPLTLQGRENAILDGEGNGDVIRVRAEDVIIRDLTIKNAGRNLTYMNAGVFVEKTAVRFQLVNNRIDTSGFGVWLDACKDASIIGNKVNGHEDVRSQDRGNGIHLYAVSGAQVIGNEIWHARDGIYIDTSNDNVLRDNIIHDLRYGIHYMYSHHNRVEGNRTYRTRTGYALMQSHHLEVFNNYSHEDQNYGILLNFITYSVIAGNVVENARMGTSPGGGGDIGGAEGKALFVYNSLFNEVHDNIFTRSDIGIHLTAGSEDNFVWHNSFINNHVQVKYVATREQEWSRDGRGNFWSDYLGWDRNADGIGDRPYEPNDAVDKLLWRYPTARILMNSPAVEILHWVQQYFPVMRPQGVRDSTPLMQPPQTASDPT